MPKQLGVNFAPKLEEKQKQLPSVAIFSQPNLMKIKKNKNKKQGLQPSVTIVDTWLEYNL